MARIVHGFVADYPNGRAGQTGCGQLVTLERWRSEAITMDGHERSINISERLSEINCRKCKVALKAQGAT